MAVMTQKKSKRVIRPANSAVRTAHKLPAPKPVYDLNKEQDVTAFRKLGEEEDYEDISAVYNRSGLTEFIEKGQTSSIIYGKNCQIFQGRGTSFHTVIMMDNRFYVVDDPLDGMDVDELISEIDNCDTETPSGVWLSNQKLVLLNGDTDEFATSMVDTLPTKLIAKMPTVSFKCIEQFYKESQTHKAIERLCDGKLAYLDHTEDNSFDPTKEHKKIIAAAAKKKLPIKIKPPKRGYTLVGDRWHRPGAVLLHEKVEGWYILTGQDDDSYFGVELQGCVETVNEALESLTPKEVRGLPYERQGEWFIVNVAEKDIPAKVDCLVLADSGGNHGCEKDTSMYLPIETEESNRHWILSKDVRVTMDGRIYARSPELIHDDHPNTKKEGWCTFYKNTAIRSYSQEGVD